MASEIEIIDKRRTGETGAGHKVTVSAKMAELLMQRYNVNGRRMIIVAKPTKVSIVEPTKANVSPITPKPKRPSRAKK